MGKCNLINNSNFPYVSDIISLIIYERNYTLSSMLCFLPDFQSIHSKLWLCQSQEFVASEFVWSVTREQSFAERGNYLVALVWPHPIYNQRFGILHQLHIPPLVPHPVNLHWFFNIPASKAAAGVFLECNILIQAGYNML